MTSRPWIEQLKQLHNRAFEFDWSSHLQNLNRDLGLAGPHELAVPAPGFPPSWFVGDVEAIEPHRWVLVISLNQAQHDAGGGYTPQTFWDHWRWLNTDDWYPRFYRPFARLAAKALGLEVSREQEPEFTTTSVVFIEFCPYSSGRFALSGEDLIRLNAQDRGFQTASLVRRTLIDEASPALVMVNGRAGLDAMEHIEAGRLKLGERHVYRSVSRPEKRLWHREGHLTAGDGSVPLIGFPFLRTRVTHNSYREIDQLGDRARALVSENSRQSGP